MKRGRKLILLVGILAVAIGAYLLISSLKPSEDEGDTDVTLVDASIDSINSLTWSAGDGETQFKRKENGWVNATDEAFPVDQDRVKTLLAAVTKVTSSRTISEVQDFSQYGLDKPALTVKVGYSDGTQNVYELGNKNNITDDYYMRMDGGADVHLVPKDISEAFNVPLMDFIAKEKIPYMDSPVGLSVQSKSGIFKLKYIEDSTGLTYSNLFRWFQDTGEGYRTVDTYNVLTFVDKIEALKWSEVVAYNVNAGKLADYGLDNPSAVLTIEYEKEDDSGYDRFVLELGDYNADGNCYARIRGSSLVYLIDGETADSIIKLNYDSVEPDEVCYMEMNELQALDVVFEGRTYHVEIDRSGNDPVYTCDGTELDAEKMSSLLKSLKDLRASGSTSDPGAARDEVLGFTFYRDAGQYSVMPLHFYGFDSANYLVEFNGETRQLVKRDSIDKMVSTVKELFVSKANTTP